RREKSPPLYAALPAPHLGVAATSAGRVTGVRTAQLGHAAIQLPVDTYGKWLPMGNKAAGAALEIINGPMTEYSITGRYALHARRSRRSSRRFLRARSGRPRPARRPDRRRR